MHDQISPQCAAFMSDYINDEIARGKTIDKFTIMLACIAFVDGEEEEEDYE